MTIDPTLTDHVFISVLPPVSALAFRGEIAGHFLEVKRVGVTDPCRHNGKCTGDPVHYLPEGLEADDLEVRVDGRIVFHGINEHQIIPAGNGFPREELYCWTTKAHLDGFEVQIGIPSDAPRCVVDGADAPSLVIVAFNIIDEENPPLSSEVWGELTTDPYTALRSYLEPSDECDDREWRAAFASILAKREQALSLIHI